MSSSCKDLLSISKEPSDNLDTKTNYSKRLSYAAIANKSQKSTIEKLKTQLESQSDLNKHLSTKLDRVIQLCNSRQVLIKNLKDNITKMKSERLEMNDEKKSLLDELSELRLTSKMKLSATQESLIQMTCQNKEDQEELKTQIASMKFQIETLRKELRAKEVQIADFVKKTKDSVSAELIKLSNAVDLGTIKLRTAENKTKELCKAIIKLLSMFYQRRMARRLVGDKMLPVPQKSSLSKKEIMHKSKSAKEVLPIDDDETSMASIKIDTEDAMEEIKKDLNKVSSSTVASLKDVIGQFHFLLHKTHFSEELGIFLFNNIVTPLLFD